MPYNGQAASLSNLPLELKVEILRPYVGEEKYYDDLCTLRALSLVDSTFHRLVIPTLWQHLYLTNKTLTSLLVCAAEIAPRHALHVRKVTFVDNLAAYRDPDFYTPPPMLTPAEIEPIFDFLDSSEEERRVLASAEAIDGAVPVGGLLETYLHARIIRQLPAVTTLDVYYQLDRKDKPYEQLVHSLRHLAPHLRTLRLTCDEEKRVDVNCRERIALDWLAPFTEVESLWLSFQEHEDYDYGYSTVSTTLAPHALVNALTGMTKLTTLRIFTEALLSEEFARADWSRVPLEVVQIGLGRPKASDEDLHSSSLLHLIRQVAKTLRELRISDYLEEWRPPHAHPSTRPPPPPLVLLNLPHLKKLHLDVLDLDSTGAIIASFANCPIMDLTLGRLAFTTPATVFAAFANGGWKPTLKYLQVPYDRWKHFTQLQALAVGNGVAVEMEDS